MNKKLKLAWVILMVTAAAATSFSAATSQVRSQVPTERAQAVFAGGCFWCTEADFDKIPGVLSTTSGYTGGKLRNPTYEAVSAGGTGHIEAVRVTYDPAKISYATLAARFIRTIDPLDTGGSFCDRGYRYRSAFFVSTAAQRQVAENIKVKTQGSLKKPVVTLVLPATTFYPAEAYHQDYYKKNPIRYRFYRLNCGRDARLKQIWG
ncbi:peptide-methionine (S)-S-oxide reductase MsrA [Sphingorhabdus sp.]|uniref:peptide-methionine (S)-S-oxide reductase MsrA n=1 Tax=Sphingorhabdus sp. TaxID=1902408 RepID=UPI0039830B26